MPWYIQFDPNSTPVTGTIINRWASADPSVVVGKPNILQVTREVSRALTKFHKIEGGVIKEMTQVEKDALLLAEEEARKEAQRQATDNLDVTVKDVIVALIKRINVRIPANPITKQEVIDQIKGDLGL